MRATRAHADAAADVDHVVLLRALLLASSDASCARATVYWPLLWTEKIDIGEIGPPTAVPVAGTLRQASRLTRLVRQPSLMCADCENHKAIVLVPFRRPLPSTL